MNRQQLLEVLNRLEVGKIRESGQNLMFLCPLAKQRHHNGVDHDPSMGISFGDGVVSLVNCFGCGFKGPVSRLIEEISFTAPPFMYSDLINLVLDQEAYAAIDQIDTLPGYEQYEDFPTPTIYEESILNPYAGSVPRYTLDRGITLSTSVVWGLGHDKQQRRLVFPVRNRIGGLVGLVGRSYDEHTSMRYLNYWMFKRGFFLFGEHLIRSKRLILVEGIIDAVKTWQSLRELDLLDDYSVVALFGAQFTQPQIKKIIDYADDVILMLDNDRAGIAGTDRLLREIAPLLVAFRAVYPPDVKDPDGLSPEQLHHMLDNARFFYDSTI